MIFSRLKLALLVCCALGTLLLNRAARRMPRTEFSFPAKVAAAALLLCWLALPLLGREVDARLLLFGGGFTRETLLELCRSELRAAGGRG